MYELIPILAGLLAGLGAARLNSRSTRVALISGTACTVGPLAAAVSGELAESWAFLLWDTAQVLLVGLLVFVAVSRFESRRAHGASGKR